MKGIILVGGFGTRLRPLTLTKPKPMVPFMNKPIILHQIEALSRAGVSEVILAVGHMHESLKKEMEGLQETVGVKVEYSVENTPMGTGGPLSLLKSLLEQEKDPFFILNSDVICDFPFKEMLEYHTSHERAGTIVSTRVEDPSKYGVILVDEHNTIQQFIEKPKEHVGNRINAGLYLFSKEILEYVEQREMSIEKEILPRMVEKSLIMNYDLNGYWMDIGQPKDYLHAHAIYLSTQRNPPQTVHIDSSARVSSSARIHSHTVIGPNVIVEEGAEISGSVVLEGAVVKKHAFISNSIIGWRSVVGSWSRIEECSVLGANVIVEENIHITHGRIHPDTQVSMHISLPSSPLPLLSSSTP